MTHQTNQDTETGNISPEVIIERTRKELDAIFTEDVQVNPERIRRIQALLQRLNDAFAKRTSERINSISADGGKTSQEALISIFKEISSTSPS